MRNRLVLESVSSRIVVRESVSDGRKKTFTVPVYLREQLVAHRAHITFLQETRATKSCVIESRTHVRLVSAASGGHGGTEIWCQRYIGTHHDIAVRAKDIIVLHAHAELLIIKCVYAGLPLICVTAHAPHTGRPNHEHDAFWSSLIDTLRTISRAVTCLLILMPTHTLIVIRRILALMDLNPTPTMQLRNFILSWLSSNSFYHLLLNTITAVRRGLG